MKKLCLILLAATAAFIASATTSFGAGIQPRQGGQGSAVVVSPGQQPVFVQMSGESIGFSVNENSYPTLGIFSAPDPMVNVTLTFLSTGQQSSRHFFRGNKYYESLPIFGNGDYEVVIQTTTGTFTQMVTVSGLPNYEPGDPRIPMPVDDPIKF